MTCLMSILWLYLLRKVKTKKAKKPAASARAAPPPPDDDDDDMIEVNLYSVMLPVPVTLLHKP